MSEPHIIPSRFRLTVDKLEVVCNFTANLPYFASPHSNDVIVFGESAFYVEYLYHYMDGEKSCMVMVQERDFDAMIEFLIAFDTIKDEYEIYDIKSNRQPPSYYVMYRLVKGLMDSSYIQKSEFVSFIECVRSIIIADLKPADVSQCRSALKGEMELLLNMCLECLQNQAEDRLHVLLILSMWEPKFNDSKREWDVEIADVKPILKKSLTRVTSIPSELKERLIDD